MSILKIKSVGGGSGEFTDAGSYYFNIDRLTCATTENVSGCILITDVKKGGTNNPALCFELVTSNQAAVLQAVVDAIKSNPGGEVIDLKLPQSVTITAIEAKFFEV
tara:strand:+ start:6178 stop:6495 length:318 start_codon:yes stop_codon:yes gene_type:complete